MNEHKTSNEIGEDPEKKYPALSFIAGFYKVLGIFVVVITIVIIFFSALMFLERSDLLGWKIILATVFIGPILAISLFTLSESIMVFIDIAGSLSKIKEDMGEDLSEIKRRLADKSD